MHPARSVSAEPLNFDAPSLEVWLEEQRFPEAGDGPFRTRLTVYLQELCRWNRHYNLTGCRSFPELLERHVQDVMTLSPHLPVSSRCADVGTGAGLPGLVLAMRDHSAPWLLVESNQKKARFLLQVVHQLKLTWVTVHGERAELPPASWRGQCDFLTMRAMTSLNHAAPLALPYLRSSGALMMMKGEEHPAELADYLSKPLPEFLPPETIPLAPRSWLVKLQRFT